MGQLGDGRRLCCYIARIQHDLDVGGGTGLSFAALENGVDSEGRIIGINQSLEQHAKARALAAQNGWQDITLLSSAVENAQIPLIAANHWR